MAMLNNPMVYKANALPFWNRESQGAIGFATRKTPKSEPQNDEIRR